MAMGACLVARQPNVDLERVYAFGGDDAADFLVKFIHDVVP
jgi:hypothetical protein